MRYTRVSVRLHAYGASGHAEIRCQCLCDLATISSMTDHDYAPDASVPSRPLIVTLPQAEWEAISALEPDPVAWLRSVIRERLATVGSGEPGARRSA